MPITNLKMFESLGNKEEKIKILEKAFELNEIEKQLIMKYDFVTKSILNIDSEFALGCRHVSKEFTNESSCNLEEAVKWLKDDLNEAVKRCSSEFKKFPKLLPMQQMRLIAFSFNLGNKFVEFKKIIEGCK